MRIRRALPVVAVALTAVASATNVLANVVPVGPRFQINEYTPGFQGHPRIAALPDGTFAVVWESEGQDGDGLGVLARVFSRVGQPFGGEFRLNSHTQADQWRAGLIALADASFLAAWSDYGQGVRGQRFNGIGQLLGHEVSLPVRGATAMASRSDGGFVAAWSSGCVANRGLSCIRAGVFDTDGAPRSPSFEVSPNSAFHNPASPSVTVLPDDSFAVVWFHERDGASDVLQGRLFDEHGHSVTREFDIAPYDGAGGCHLGFGLCAGRQGQIVVAWADASESAAYRRYDSVGQPLTPVVDIAPRPGSIDLDQYCPSASCTVADGFLTVLAELREDHDFHGITGRYFPEGDAEQAEEFFIGVPALWLIRPVVAGLTNGTFALVWDECPTRQDCDIFGQRFAVSGLPLCPGDCATDGTVTIDDLITALNIALNPFAVGTRHCLAADANLNGAVSIDELVAAVGAALESCDEA